MKMDGGRNRSRALQESLTMDSYKHRGLFYAVRRQDLKIWRQHIGSARMIMFCAAQYRSNFIQLRNLQ
jgi:hypothetical protein